jgi:signal transduction histidine kinase
MKANEMKHQTKQLLILLFILFTEGGFAQNNAQSFNSEMPTLYLQYPLPDSLPIMSYMDCFVDSSKSKTLENIDSQIFRPLTLTYLGSVSDCISYRDWLRLKAVNETTDTLKMSLYLHPFDTVSVFVFQNGQFKEEITVGRMIRVHPQKEKAFYPSNRTVLLTFPPKANMSFIIKGRKHTCTWYLNPILFTEKSEAGYFGREWLWVYTWNSFFFGILLMIMVYTLVNYFQQRHRSFLYYTGYIFAHFFYYWYIFEGYNHFSNVLPAFLFDYVYYIPIAWSWGLFYILFVDSFFEAKKEMPTLHYWLRISFYFVLAFLLLERIVVSIDYHLAWQVSVYLKYFLTLGGIGLTTYLITLLKENPLTKYIFTGSLLFGIGTLIIRIFPDSNSRFWDTSLIPQQIGIIAELICFSAGLAYKSHRNAVEKERFEAENKQLQLEKELDLARLRNQIAQDIHDEIGAGLTKISLNAQVAARLSDLTYDEYRDRLSKIDNDARQIGSQMREIVFAINPDYDNFEDLQAYFKENAREFWSESGIEPVFDFEKSEHNPIVSPQTKRQLLLIFKEAQNNAAKHAHAKCIFLSLKLISFDQFVLEIRDNGKGFASDAKNGYSKGLTGMKHRAEEIGAAFSIKSEIGKGTTIKIIGKF